MDTLTLALLALNVVLLLVLAVLAWRRWVPALPLEVRRREVPALPPTQELAAPRLVKCNARQFLFDNGQRMEFHPVCNKLPLADLTEDYARAAFAKQSPTTTANLASTTDIVHYVIT